MVVLICVATVVSEEDRNCFPLKYRRLRDRPTSSCPIRTSKRLFRLFNLHNTTEVVCRLRTSFFVESTQIPALKTICRPTNPRTSSSPSSLRTRTRGIHLTANATRRNRRYAGKGRRRAVSASRWPCILRGCLPLCRLRDSSVRCPWILLGHIWNADGYQNHDWLTLHVPPVGLNNSRTARPAARQNST